MDPLPVSDQPASALTLTSRSILSGGGSGSAKKEGRTSRGGATAFGGRGNTFADVVGQGNGHRNRLEASAAAASAAAAAASSTATSGSLKTGGSRHHNLRHTGKLSSNSSCSSPSSSSSSSRKRGRTHHDAGPSPTAAVAAAAAAHSSKSSHPQDNSIYNESGYARPNKKGTATGHAGMPALPNPMPSDYWRNLYAADVPEDDDDEKKQVEQAEKMSVDMVTSGDPVLASQQQQQQQQQKQEKEKLSEDEEMSEAFPPLPAPTSSSDSAIGQADKGKRKSILPSTHSTLSRILDPARPVGKRRIVDAASNTDGSHMLGAVVDCAVRGFDTDKDARAKSGGDDLDVVKPNKADIHVMEKDCGSNVAVTADQNMVVATDQKAEVGGSSSHPKRKIVQPSRYTYDGSGPSAPLGGTFEICCICAAPAGLSDLQQIESSDGIVLMCSVCISGHSIDDDDDHDDDGEHPGVCKCGRSHEEGERGAFWVQCSCEGWTIVTARPECAGFSRKAAKDRTFECTLCAQFDVDEEEECSDAKDVAIGADGAGANEGRQSKRRRVTNGRSTSMPIPRPVSSAAPRSNRSGRSTAPIATIRPPRPANLSTTPVDISKYTRGDFGISDEVSSIIDNIRSMPRESLSPGYQMILAMDDRVMDATRNTGSDAFDDAYANLNLVEETVANTGGTKWDNLLNLSNPPLPSQSHVICTNYAPMGDLEYVNPLFSRDKVDVRANGCMIAGHTMMPGGVVRRGGHEYTDELASATKDRIAFLDYIIIVCTKKKETSELKLFCTEGLEIAYEHYAAIPALILASHAKLRHLATNGVEKLAVMHSGKNPSEKLGAPPKGCRAVDLCGKIRHLENYVDRRKLKGSYLRDRQKTESNNNVILRFYGSIDCITDLVPSSIRLIEEWCGVDKMSKEEIMEEAKVFREMNKKTLDRLHEIQRAGYRNLRRLSVYERMIFAPMKKNLDRNIDIIKRGFAGEELDEDERKMFLPVKEALDSNNVIIKRGFAGEELDEDERKIFLPVKEALDSNNDTINRALKAVANGGGTTPQKALVARIQAGNHKKRAESNEEKGIDPEVPEKHQLDAECPNCRAQYEAGKRKTPPKVWKRKLRRGNKTSEMPSEGKTATKVIKATNQKTNEVLFLSVKDCKSELGMQKSTASATCNSSPSGGIYPGSKRPSNAFPKGRPPFHLMWAKAPKYVLILERFQPCQCCGIKDAKAWPLRKEGNNYVPMGQREKQLMTVDRNTHRDRINAEK